MFGELFHRYEPADLDAGFEQAYESGCRWLRAREGAADWTLPRETAARVEELFETVGRLPAAEVDEWLERFPRAFMRLLERRTARIEVDGPRRRESDRHAAAIPVPRWDSLVGAAR